MAFYQAGSSPHTRGAHGRSWPRCRAPQDHPRIRGEHSCGRRLSDLCEGIIPAYAGSTNHLCQSMGLVRGSSPHTRGALIATAPYPLNQEDHPRIRGEHRRRYRSNQQHAGIIPAYAGSTCLELLYLYHVSGSSPHTRGARIRLRADEQGRGDHPRIRGEHDIGVGNSLLEVGIIPAYAGSTSAQWKTIAT